LAANNTTALTILEILSNINHNIFWIRSVETPVMRKSYAGKIITKAGFTNDTVSNSALLQTVFYDSLYSLKEKSNS